MGKFGSKYRIEYCDSLIDHMATGASFTSFGAKAGVGPGTLAAWCSAHDEFQEARDRGLLDQGLSQRAIIDRLNADGVPAPRGGPWWPRTLTRFLTRTTAQERRIKPKPNRKRA